MVLSPSLSIYNKFKTFFFSLFTITAVLFTPCVLAETATITGSGHLDVDNVNDNPEFTPVKERKREEESIPANNFAITMHRPNYVLPFYYTGSPYNSVYQANMPSYPRLRHGEFKYQISLKVPLWKRIFTPCTTLWMGYTQLSYWQLYTSDSFFRETDYEPELYFANELNMHLIGNWRLNFLNFGAAHQSNGFGGVMERTWDRIYLDAITSVGNWMIDIKPWYILNTSGKREHNDNIATYMGYGQVLVAYQFHKNVISLMARNVIESGAKRAAGELTWSFPITPYIKGYVQVFSGYGQSLIEYNHRTNSAGIGLALSDWV